MNIILLGPPGAGKGTQARFLKDFHNLTIIATGDILREEVDRKTTLGKRIQQTMESGQFPEDETVLEVFEDHLKKVKCQGVILDGIPRTLNQAEKIDEIFMHHRLTIDAVIQLSVDEEELAQRLSNRVLCKACGTPKTSSTLSEEDEQCQRCSSRDFIRRTDDKPDAIKTRLDVYNKQTKPLIDYYSKTGRLIVVDGMKPEKLVYQEIDSHLNKMQVLTSEKGCLYSAQDV